MENFNKRMLISNKFKALTNWVESNELDMIESVCVKYRKILKNNFNYRNNVKLQYKFLYEVVKIFSTDLNILIRCKKNTDLVYKKDTRNIEFDIKFPDNFPIPYILGNVKRDNSLFDYVTLLSVYNHNNHISYNTFKNTSYAMRTSSRLNNLIIDMMTFSLICIPFYKSPFVCTSHSITNINKWIIHPMFNGVYFNVFIDRYGEKCIHFNDMVFNPIIYGSIKESCKKFSGEITTHIYNKYDSIKVDIYKYYFNIIYSKIKSEELKKGEVLDMCYVHSVDKMITISKRGSNGLTNIYFNESIKLEGNEIESITKIPTTYMKDIGLNCNTILGYILINKTTMINNSTMQHSGNEYTGPLGHQEIKFVITFFHGAAVNYIYEHIYNDDILLNYDQIEYEKFINIYNLININIKKKLDKNAYQDKYSNRETPVNELKRLVKIFPKSDQYIKYINSTYK